MEWGTIWKKSHKIDLKLVTNTIITQLLLTIYTMDTFDGSTGEGSGVRFEKNGHKMYLKKCDWIY